LKIGLQQNIILKTSYFAAAKVINLTKFAGFICIYFKKYKYLIKHAFKTVLLNKIKINVLLLLRL